MRFPFGPRSSTGVGSRVRDTSAGDLIKGVPVLDLIDEVSNGEDDNGSARANIGNGDVSVFIFGLLTLIFRFSLEFEFVLVVDEISGIAIF